MDTNNIHHDGSLSDTSSDPPSPSSSSGLPRGRPNCGNCRNHGIIIPLRGHKQDCPNRGCECECCILTRLRREVMARQTNLTRQRRQEVRMSRERGVQDEVEGPRDRGRNGDTPGSQGVALARSEGDTPRIVFDLEEHSYGANELIKAFKLDMNALPFAYAVMSVAGNLQNAYDLIAEASDEFNRNSHRPNSFDSSLGAGPSAFSQVSHRNPDRDDGDVDINRMNPRNHQHVNKQHRPNNYDPYQRNSSRHYDPYSRDSSPSPPPR